MPGRPGEGGFVWKTRAPPVRVFASFSYASPRNGSNLIDATARVHGADHEIVLRTRRVYARALYSGENAPLSDVRQAVKILEEICPKTRQVLGPNHPRTSHCERLLMLAQEKLGQAEAPVARRTRSSKAEES